MGTDNVAAPDSVTARSADVTMRGCAWLGWAIARQTNRAQGNHAEPTRSPADASRSTRTSPQASTTSLVRSWCLALFGFEVMKTCCRFPSTTTTLATEPACNIGENTGHYVPRKNHSTTTASPTKLKAEVAAMPRRNQRMAKSQRVKPMLAWLAALAC